MVDRPGGSRPDPDAVVAVDREVLATYTASAEVSVTLNTARHAELGSQQGANSDRLRATPRDFPRSSLQLEDPSVDTRRRLR